LSLPSYRLSYGPGKARFFLTLCLRHLKHRLTTGASILEKRDSWPETNPCADCLHSKAKGK
jgi:hypothetical protein